MWCSGLVSKNKHTWLKACMKASSWQLTWFITIQNFRKEWSCINVYFTDKIWIWIYLAPISLNHFCGVGCCIARNIYLDRWRLFYQQALNKLEICEHISWKKCNSMYRLQYVVQCVNFVNLSDIKSTITKYIESYINHTITILLLTALVM